MQKTVCLAMGLALASASCDEKPAGRPTVVNDQLWGLAPEGARGGLVVSPYALGAIEDGSLELRDFLAKAGAEGKPFLDQVEGLLQPFGGGKAKLADLGLTRTKGGALFLGGDGKLAVVVLPIADRDAFLAKVGGTKATTPDGLDQIQDARCKLAGPHYACSRDEQLLASLGKGTLKASLAKAGARGDLEVVVETNLGEGPASVIAAAAQLERGAMTMRGVITNPPAGMLAWLGSPLRPKTAIGRSAGFGVLDVRPMLADIPPLPLVEGVTIVDVAKTLAGPLTMNVPAGELSIEMEQPLTDGKPLTQVLAQCEQVAPLRQFAAKLVDGTCRITLPEANLELDVWVDGTTLRVGKKGSTAKGANVQLPPAALEMATGQWGFVVWGRGSIFSPTGKPPATDLPNVSPEMLAPIRLLAMVNEAGFAMKKETTKDGDVARFLLTARSGFANPAPVVEKLVTLGGMDILANTAATKAEPIAKAHAGSPFAADFTAGQAGLLVATYLVGSGMQQVAPLVLGFAGAGRGAPAEAPAQPALDGSRTKRALEQYATLVYPEWLKANAGKPCPTMQELAGFVAPDATTVDEWGHPITVVCGKDLPANVKGIGLVSPGPDGQAGSPDDVTSY